MRALATITSFLLLLSLLSCRSEFEKIRTSGDPNKIKEEADRLFEKGEYTRSITLMELVIPSFRGRAGAEDLSYQFADAHYLNGSYTLAAHYFKSFAETYGASPRREEAMYRSAYCNYRLSPRSQLDQESSQRAIDAFQLFVNTYPNSERVVDCNRYIDELRNKLEEKAFNAGRLYYNTKNYSSAIQSLDNLLKDFPGTTKTEEARFLLVKASLDWADNSIYLRQQERYQKTIDRCKSYLRKHPDSKRAEEVSKFQERCEKELNNIQNG